MEKINFNKAVRIGLGSALSYFICEMMGLNYAASAAVITLLSIQDTKKDTIVDVLKRICSYIVALGMAIVLFNTIGYNMVAFGIFMLLLVIISYIMGWTNTLSSSTVVTSHLLMEQTFEVNFLLNEILLLAVGTSIAVFLNILLRDKSRYIEQDMSKVEEKFSAVLKSIGKAIQDKSHSCSEGLMNLQRDIDNTIDDIINNINNTPFDSSQYYMEYMEMRREQCYTLNRIYDNILDLNEAIALPLTEDILEYLAYASDNLHQKGSYEEMRTKTKGMLCKFQNLDLPTNREEFGNMALLADILKEMDYFLELYRVFINSLDKYQSERYWKE